MLKMVSDLLGDHGELIFLCRCGSHLYGTNTDKSDLDIKGVYLPSMKDMILGRIKHTISSPQTKEKNTADDIDIELFSIHHFLKLLKNGETIAIDMLHCNQSNIYQQSPKFTTLWENRKSFYTRKMKAFTGYAKNQAVKYGVKGDRLKTAKMCINFLDNYFGYVRLKDIWSLLPVTEHSYFKGKNANGLEEYNICGKIIQETVSVDYFRDILNNFIKTYGNRSMIAMESGGADWKALSHALRVCFELKEIYLTNDLVFPLRDADYLLKIKKGEVNYKEVIDRLELEIEEISRIAERALLPENVTQDFCDMLIMNSYLG